MSLHDELHRLAETQPPFLPDPSAWDRGRRARQRSRVVAGVTALTVVAVVGGLGALAIRPHGVGPAAQEVAGGAIPSRIVEPGADVPELREELDVGRASVAFVSPNGGFPDPYATVIDATDGSYHFLSLPDLDTDREALALSPDGNRLAWRTADDELHVADLVSGEVTDLDAAGGPRPNSWELNWLADSTTLTWAGGRRGGLIDVVTGTEVVRPVRDRFLWGPVSPDKALVAVPSGRRVRAAVFETRDGEQLLRPLPTDQYPKGATIEPLGWASDHLVLARLSAPEGSYAEGDHLALLTSPDRPESEWTYRILVRDVPGGDDFSLAVDLIPDLDGTSSQELTHDFGDTTDSPPAPLGIELSLLIGLGVAAAIALLMALRWLWRRLT